MSSKSFHQSLESAKQHLFSGRVRQAIELLSELEKQSQQDALQLQNIAEMYVHCGQHERAGKCYARSVELRPSDPACVYNLATSKLALGELEEAETLFTRVIKLKPDDYGAWLNRSSLKKQTRENNHVEQLKYVKAHLEADDPGQIPICYALAKELEDLGHYEDSFAFLQEGSHQRRLRLQYDVRDDEEVMQRIARRFKPELLQGPHPQHDTQRPVFILGLPRSGTTLVDRIVSSHSQVASLGEHDTLAYALMQQIGEASGKQELVEQSASIDFAELGRRYCDGIEGYGNPAARLIDKTPQNFLYLGLIHLALPGAKIIHLRRKPLDSCYAIYKTLFRAGYPYSYSLQDMGRYYIAYHRLMEHWRRHIPGGFLDVDYEKLVGDQENQSRRIFDYLELDWEDAALDFHHRSEPVATASAAQVRQPIYHSSVNRWRCYERQLKPFAGKLREHGIEIDPV